jgi:hypothetical protein
MHTKSTNRITKPLDITAQLIIPMMLHLMIQRERVSSMNSAKEPSFAPIVKPDLTKKNGL